MRGTEYAIAQPKRACWHQLPSVGLKNLFSVSTRRQRVCYWMVFAVIVVR